jgi:hypothetical protein
MHFFPSRMHNDLLNDAWWVGKGSSHNQKSRRPNVD